MINTKGFDIINYRSKWQRVVTHSLLWFGLSIFFLVYELTIENKTNILAVFRDNSFHMLVDILFTYLIIFFIDNFLFRKKYIYFILLTLGSLILEFFIYRALLYIIISVFYPERNIGESLESVSTIFIVYSMTFPIVLFSILHIVRRSILSQARISEIVNENLTNELTLLKNQLNQHSLFNTLNNIDSHIYSNPDKASRSINNLSGLLRYSLYETGCTVVPMVKEIEYITNYLELFTSNSDLSKNINFTIEGDYSSILIAPMLFVPFIENCLKHGDFAGSKSIDIGFAFEGDIVYFQTSNFKMDCPGKASIGIGIENVKRRLELIYKGKYKLEIRDHNERFNVYLKLDSLVSEQVLSN